MPTTIPPTRRGAHAALQASIEACLLTYHRTVADLLAARGLVTIHADPGVFWFLAHETALDMLNSASAFQWRWNEADTRIEAVLSGAGQVPMLWWIGPATQPPDLGERLLARGFRPGQVIGGMALPLARLPERVLAPEDVRFAVATTAGDVQAALGVIIAALGGVSPGLREALAVLAEGTLGIPERLRLLLAWRGDVAVGITWLVLAEDVAGVFHTTVLPGQRGQGIGTALAAAALRHAGAAGCSLGVILAGRQQQGMARALGFQEYCVLLQYFSPDQAGMLLP